MKKLFLFCLGLFTVAMLFAQSPDAFNYQAVVRDATGAIKANQSVNFRISILEGSFTGAVVLQETHPVSTNEFGLVNLEIGNGYPVSGNIASINWVSNTYYLKVELDPTGGTSFINMGTSKLLSVPYALHAKTVQIDQVDDADADPANEIQEIQLTGTVLTLSKGGGTVTLPSAGGGDNWGTQTVITDATLSGNGTTATPLKIADNGITSAKISDGTVGNADLAEDAVNSGKILDGSIVTADLADSAVTTDKINPGAVTGERIAQGGATSGQALKWNGTAWAPANDETGAGLTLPYGGSYSRNSLPVFSIKNPGTGMAILGESTSGTAVFGMTDGNNSSGVYGLGHALSGVNYGVRGENDSPDGFSGYFLGNKFYISGNTGIGVEIPTSKLDVDGQIKIRGGSPGEGKVLTSDPSGLALWKNPEPCRWDLVGSYMDGGQVKYVIAYNKGKVGIGTIAPSAMFELQGSFRYNFGSPALGKVLTSDSDGFVSWQSPSSGLTLPYSGSSASNGIAFRVVNNYSGTESAMGIYGEATKAGGTAIVGSATSVNGVSTAIVGFVNSPDGYSGYFTGGRFFVDGKVGIGTNNPAARLDVSASQGPNIIIRDSDGGAGRPGIQFINNYIHYIGGDDQSEEIFGIYSGYGNNRNYAARLNIHGPATNNWGQHLSLTHDGNHGRIGTDAGYLVLEPAGQRVGLGTDAPTQNLDVNGTLRVRGMTSGSSAGTVYRTTDGTLITGASDVRLKDNIEPLKNSLGKVLQLDGVTFSWKSDPEGRRNIGFIAQDFEKVIPELVFTNETDGYKGINYAEVSAVLVEAIKELKTENDRLKGRLEKIEQLLSAEALSVVDRSDYVGKKEN